MLLGCNYGFLAAVQDPPRAMLPSWWILVPTTGAKTDNPPRPGSYSKLLGSVSLNNLDPTSTTARSIGLRTPPKGHYQTTAGLAWPPLPRREGGRETTTHTLHTLVSLFYIPSLPTKGNFGVTVVAGRLATNVPVPAFLVSRNHSARGHKTSTDCSAAFSISPNAPKLVGHPRMLRPTFISRPLSNYQSQNNFPRHPGT